MILDVGCGNRPRGNVNLDLSETAIGAENFIIGDAQHLPFRRRTFDIVYASNVLEHLFYPPLAIMEFKYACKGKVIIRVPNDPKVCEHPSHLYSWSATSLGNFLRLFFKHVDMSFYTEPFDIVNSRLIKLPVLGKIFLRLLLRIAKLEIVAICQILNGSGGTFFSKRR